MSGDSESESTLLILPDGRLLVRNVTPELSALLLTLQPENADLAVRAKSEEAAVSLHSI